MRAVDRSSGPRRWRVGVIAASAVCFAGALLGRGSVVHLGVVFGVLVLTGPAALVCGGAWMLDGVGRRWAGARSSGAGAPVVAGLVALWLGVIASLPLGMAVGAWLEARTEAWASTREPRVEHFERVRGRRPKHAEYWELVGPLPWYARASNVRYNDFLGQLERAD